MIYTEEGIVLALRRYEADAVLTQFQKVDRIGADVLEQQVKSRHYGGVFYQNRLVPRRFIRTPKLVREKQPGIWYLHGELWTLRDAEKRLSLFRFEHLKRRIHAVPSEFRRGSDNPVLILVDGRLKHFYDSDRFVPDLIKNL